MTVLLATATSDPDGVHVLPLILAVLLLSAAALVVWVRRRRG